MEISKNENNTYQVIISEKDLQQNNLTKQQFMTNTEKQTIFLNQIKQKIITKYNLTIALEEKYTYLIKNTFIIHFYPTEHTYKFQTEQDLQNFYNFIQTTKYSKNLYINNKTHEIHLSQNTPQTFYTLLKEFTT